MPLSQQQLEESLNNMFDLSSTDQTIRYLHACDRFPTKRTWVKTIKKGNFVGRPMLTVENVNKHFPESEETAKRHINHQRQVLGPQNQMISKSQTPTTKLEKGKRHIHECCRFVGPKRNHLHRSNWSLPYLTQRRVEQDTLLSW